MKKWEYTAITGTAESDLVNILGSNGWEAYAVISHNADSTKGYILESHLCTFFLKRELVDSKQVIL